MNKMTDKELQKFIDDVDLQIKELQEKRYAAQRQVVARRDVKHSSMWSALQIDDTYNCIVGVAKTTGYHCSLIKGYMITGDINKNNASAIEFEYREDDYVPSLAFDTQTLYFSELEHFYNDFNVYVVSRDVYNSLIIELISLEKSYQDYQQLETVLKQAAKTVISYM